MNDVLVSSWRWTSRSHAENEERGQANGRQRLLQRFQI
jgi:hypothetical protein